jgi:hypothetical protein
MAKIFEKTSEEKPTSVLLLARAIYGDRIKLKIARNRIANDLNRLKKEFKGYGLVVMTKKSDVESFKEIKDFRKRETLYYLSNEGNSTEKKNVQETAKNRLLVVESRDVFVAPSDLIHQRVTADESVEKVDEMQKTAVLTESKTPDTEIEPNFNPLDENEIFALAKVMNHLNYSWNKELRDTFGIDMQPIEESGEIIELDRLVNRINVDLEHKKTNMPNFCKENLLSACGKLKAFAKNPKAYFASCGIQAQILLKCFKSAEKIDDDFLKRFTEVQLSLPSSPRKDAVRKVRV